MPVFSARLYTPQGQVCLFFFFNSLVSSTEPETEYLLNEWKLIAEAVKLMGSLGRHSIISF